MAEDWRTGVRLPPSPPHRSNKRQRFQSLGALPFFVAGW